MLPQTDNEERVWDAEEELGAGHWLSAVYAEASSFNHWELQTELQTIPLKESLPVSVYSTELSDLTWYGSFLDRLQNSKHGEKSP